MATKNAKGVAKATKKAKTASVEVTEDGELMEGTNRLEAIEATDEVVLDVPTDITAVADGMAVCSACGVEKEQTVANFSPMAKGGFRNICKPCQTQASLAWTTKRADYRKQYQRAIQLINLGIPAIVPNAKDWQNGDVIMTVEYTRDGVTYPSRNAEEVYAEMKQAQADARAERKAQIEAQNAELKAQRLAERAELKAQRDAEKAEAKAQRDAERAEAKAQKDAERAERAEQAKLEREQKAIERAEARAVANAEKAEAKRLEREQKALERAEAQKQKALEKAQAIAEKAEARRQAAIEKALAVTA